MKVYLFTCAFHQGNSSIKQTKCWVPPMIHVFFFRRHGCCFPFCLVITIACHEIFLFRKWFSSDDHRKYCFGACVACNIDCLKKNKKKTGVYGRVLRLGSVLRKYCKHVQIITALTSYFTI